eukprot:53397-Pyramimonas_sp.AAC.1
MCGRCTVLAAAAYTDNIDTAARTDLSDLRIHPGDALYVAVKAHVAGACAHEAVAKRLCLLHGARGGPRSIAVSVCVCCTARAVSLT